VLITDFIERAKVGVLRHRGKNRPSTKTEPVDREQLGHGVVNPKVIVGRSAQQAAVAVNVRDPKDRLMILLGSLNAGDDLNQSERSEAITIAQELRNTNRINQKELQTISEALEE